MKKFIKVLVGISICIWIGCLGIPVEAKGIDTILPGVYIDNLDLSGMTETEAKEAVSQMVASRLETPITLYCPNDNEVVITPSELGMVWNNQEIVQEAVKVGKVGNIVERYKFKKDLERENYVIHTTYTLDTELVNQLIDVECVAFNQEAVDLSLSRVEGEFLITEGKQGIHIDTDAAKKEVLDFVLNDWDDTKTELTLPVVVEEPKGSIEELQKVKDLLGSYTTYYKNSAIGRATNVETGTRHINGITLYPGESFSMLETTTPFNAENGYMKGGAYVNGLVVESFGGGICQVSTTLYNAVLLAELEVTERSNHSMTVTYVPVAADAAITSSGGKDFCFTNNTDYPVYIEGITTPNKQLTFNIYGVETRPESRKIEYTSEILETILPTTENIIQDEKLPIGYTKVQSPYLGYKSRLIKIVYENGVETGREVVNKSNYKMVPRTVTVGIATDNPDAFNQIQAAIATGSIDQVCAVASTFVVPTAAPLPADAGIVPDI